MHILQFKWVGIIKKVSRRRSCCSLFTRSYLVFGSVDDKEDVINFHVPLGMAWSEPMMFPQTRWSPSWRKVFKGLWRSKTHRELCLALEVQTVRNTPASSFVIWNRRGAKDLFFFKTRGCLLRFISKNLSLNFSELFYFKGQCYFSHVSRS